MKCELCGRQYIALGVHLRRKHAVDPNDYREEFGILRTTPLVDEALSEHLSHEAKRRLQDIEYKAEVQARCRDNAEANKGKPGPGMTRAGKVALAKRNTEANAEYLKRQAPSVATVLREKKTMADVRKATGTGAVAGKKMAVIAGIEYTAQQAKAERDKRAAATIRAKALARVAKVMPHFDTTKSAAEMCRLSGISIKTYKNWLSAGLIPRHPNGRVQCAPLVSAIKSEWRTDHVEDPLPMVPEIGSPEAFAASDDPDCRQGGKACEGCLMVGWCLGDFPPDHSGDADKMAAAVTKDSSAARPGAAARAKLEATPEGRALLAAAKAHLLQCLQLTPDGVEAFTVPTAAAMEVRPCRCGPDGCSDSSCEGRPG